MYCHSSLHVMSFNFITAKNSTIPTNDDREWVGVELGTNRRRANTISLNERRVTWETCEHNDLVRRKQNRPKRHLNDAPHDVLFACEVKLGMEN